MATWVAAAPARDSSLRAVWVDGGGPLATWRPLGCGFGGGARQAQAAVTPTGFQSLVPRTHVGPKEAAPPQESGKVSAGPKARCIVGAQGTATWEGLGAPEVRDEVLLVPKGSSRGGGQDVGERDAQKQVPPDTTASPGRPRGRCRGCGSQGLPAWALGNVGRGAGRGFLSAPRPRPLRMPPRCLMCCPFLSTSGPLSPQTGHRPRSC